MSRNPEFSKAVSFTLSNSPAYLPSQFSSNVAPNNTGTNHHKAPLLPTPAASKPLSHSIHQPPPPETNLSSSTYSAGAYTATSYSSGADVGCDSSIDLGRGAPQFQNRRTTDSFAFRPNPRSSFAHSSRFEDDGQYHTSEYSHQNSPTPHSHPNHHTSFSHHGKAVYNPVITTGSGENEYTPHLTFDRSGVDHKRPPIITSFNNDTSFPSLQSPSSTPVTFEPCGLTDSSPTLQTSDPEQGPSIVLHSKPTIQFQPRGSHESSDSVTSLITPTTNSPFTGSHSGHSFSPSSAAFTHSSKVIFTPKNKQATSPLASQPSPTNSTFVNKSHLSTSEISCHFGTVPKSEGSSSSDIISTPKSMSTPSFPQFNPSISSSTLKDEPLIQRKKLTPTSNTFVPRLEINNNQKTVNLLTSLQVPLSQLFLLSRDFFHSFMASGNSLNIHYLMTALETMDDIDVAAVWMDKKRILSILKSNVPSIVSKDSAFRRFSVERPLPISSTLPFPSIPIELLSCELQSFMSHSALTQAEYLLRLDLLSQLFDIAQSVNPELVLCVTGSFPASLSLSTSDIDVVFVSKEQWRYITRIQRIIRAIFQFWYGETFTPPEPVAGSPLHSHASMMQTGLSFLNSPHIRSCPTCGAVLYQHKCSCECRLALAIEEKMFAEEKKKQPTQDDERHSLIKRLLSVPLTESIQKHLSLSRPIVTSHSVVEYPRLLIDAHPSEIKDGVDRTVNCDAPQSPKSANTQSPLAASTPAQDLLSPGSESDNDNTDSIAFGDDTIFTPPPSPTQIPMWVPPHTDTTLVDEEVDVCDSATLLSDTINKPLLFPPAPSMEPSDIDNTLTKIDHHLRLSSVPTNFIRSARIPIIKLVQPNSSLDASALKADISCGALSGIINTDYLRCILIVYPQAKPLIVALKAFLLHQKLNEPYQGGLGGYSLCLMVISHLQQHKRNFHTEASATPLGLLLVEFFALYGECTDELKSRGLFVEAKEGEAAEVFHSHSFAISVRGQGQYIPLSLLHQVVPTMHVGFDPNVDDRLVLEDPLDDTNNCTRSCYSWPTIKRTFQETLFVLLDHLTNLPPQATLAESILSAQSDEELVVALTEISALKSIVPSDVFNCRQRQLSQTNNKHFANPLAQLAQAQTPLNTNAAIFHPHFAGLPVSHARPISPNDTLSDDGSDLSVHGGGNSDSLPSNSSPTLHSSSSQVQTGPTPNPLPFAFLPTEQQMRLRPAINMGRSYRTNLAVATSTQSIPSFDGFCEDDAWGARANSWSSNSFDGGDGAAWKPLGPIDKRTQYPTLITRPSIVPNTPLDASHGLTLSDGASNLYPFAPLKDDVSRECEINFNLPDDSVIPGANPIHYAPSVQ